MTRVNIVKEKYSAVFNSAVADKNRRIRRNKNPAEITRYTVLFLLSALIFFSPGKINKEKEFIRFKWGELYTACTCIIVYA